MYFWMALQPPQHSEAVRQGQGGDICEEIRVALHQVQERLIVWLIRDQAVAASMGGDDCHALIQGNPQLVGIAGGLVLPGQDDLIPHVTEEGNLMPGKPSVKRKIPPVGGIESLGIGEDFDQLRTAFDAPVQFLDRVPPLRIDRDTGPQPLRIGMRDAKQVVIADEKFRFAGIQPTGGVVNAIQAEKNRFLHKLRFPKLCEQVVHVLLVGPSRILSFQIVLPSEKLEERATEHPGGDVAPVVLCPERRQVHMAINHPVSPSRPCAAIGRSGPAVGQRPSCFVDGSGIATVMPELPPSLVIRNHGRTPQSWQAVVSLAQCLAALCESSRRRLPRKWLARKPASTLQPRTRYASNPMRNGSAPSLVNGA